MNLNSVNSHHRKSRPKNFEDDLHFVIADFMIADPLCPPMLTAREHASLHLGSLYNTIHQPDKRSDTVMAVL